MKKRLKSIKSRINDDSVIIKANELNGLDHDEKELIEEEKDWDEELTEEEERGYNDYNWHEGDYDF
ncbi:MAG: hypothetical protein ACFFA2_11690 [Promethearchaeota archaeon]